MAKIRKTLLSSNLTIPEEATETQTESLPSSSDDDDDDDDSSSSKVGTGSKKTTEDSIE